jgi:hypothetical protein
VTARVPVTPEDAAMLRAIRSALEHVPAGRRVGHLIRWAADWEQRVEQALERDQ